MTPNTRSAGLHAALARLQQTLADRQPGVVEQAMPAEAPHERVERCERHGAWRPYKLDAQGVLRALPGCPSCSRESGLRVMDTESQTPAIFADATFETYACSSRRQEVVVMEIKRHAQRLADAGIQAKVVSVPSIRPCDTAALLAALKPCKAVITVEEHNVNGGVGSLVAEVLAEAGVGIPLKRLGIPDGEYAAAADRGWLRKHHGFDAASVAELAQKMR